MRSLSGDALSVDGDFALVWAASDGFSLARTMTRCCTTLRASLRAGGRDSGEADRIRLDRRPRLETVNVEEEVGMSDIPGPNFSVRQEISFSESCLPKTMAIALRHKRRIAAKLGPNGEDWPFEDRVLIWLAEHWSEDIAGYHTGSGAEMARRFDPDQLEHLDDHYSEKLRRRLGGCD